MASTVLGLAGSARKGGNTETLLDWCLEAARSAGAEIVKFRLWDLDLHGCRACEKCSRDGNCVVRDDMQLLYPYLSSADAIAIAAPTYFQGMPAVPKMVVDRCQPFWALKYVLKQPPGADRKSERRGAFLSCGGTRSARAFEGSRLVVQTLWHVLEVRSVGDLTYSGVDAKGDIKKQPGARQAAEELGRRLVVE